MKSRSSKRARWGAKAREIGEVRLGLRCDVALETEDQRYPWEEWVKFAEQNWEGESNQTLGALKGKGKGGNKVFEAEETNLKSDEAFWYEWVGFVAERKRGEKGCQKVSLTIR